MTDKARIFIAALITALFLGAVSAAGLIAHHPAPVSAAASSPAPTTTLTQPTTWHEQEND